VIGKCVLVISNVVQRFSFILKEIIQLLRFEEPKDKKGQPAQAIPFASYLDEGFLNFIGVLAAKFAPELATFIGSPQEVRRA